MNTTLSPLAKKQFKKLSKLIQFTVAKKIRDLNLGLEISNVKSLTKYKNIFRTRIGDYRMVYKKFPDKYYIILIEHRKSVYESLKRIW